MVKITNLVKRYGDFCLDVSMEISSGMITGIIGKNGVGKSTTIKAILGLVNPDEGEVKVFGQDAGLLTTKQKSEIGAALSDSGFSVYLTVSAITKIMKKLYHNFDEQFFLQQCQQQRIPMNKQVKDFSTGMKAKLRVLVAISHKAKLLILDEPTAGLDVEARNEILDMLRAYMTEDEKRSILISSHISSDLEGLCDDVYMIHDGKIILHEEMDVIMSQYAVLKVDEKMYEQLDRSYILETKKEAYGYECLTNQKQFYVENYPGLIVENGNVDELILMMARRK